MGDFVGECLNMRVVPPSPPSGGKPVLARHTSSIACVLQCNILIFIHKVVKNWGVTLSHFFAGPLYIYTH